MELELINRFFERKDHIIKKLNNLTDEEKNEVIEWFKTHSSYESDPSINWQNKNLTMDDFKALMAKAENSKSAKKRRIKSNAALLFEEHGQIIKETSKWIYVLPWSWEDAKFMDSSKCGGEGARWCIGWKTSPQHWNNYTSGDNPSDTSSFVIAYNKQYDPSLIDTFPKCKSREVYYNDSDELVPDPRSPAYRDFIFDQKALKYMIQILDDPDEQTDVYGADEDNPDHLVWTQDDLPENVRRYHDYDFELSDSDLYEIKTMFDKRFRSIDEEAIKNMAPIYVKPVDLSKAVNELGKNNAQCPYKIVIDGDWCLRYMPKLQRYVDISFAGGKVGKYATLNFSDDHIVHSDFAGLDFSGISDLQFRSLDSYLASTNPALREQLIAKTGTFDYAYAYTRAEATNITDKEFVNLKNMRYMFFGAHRRVISFNGCKFPKLQSMTQCFANSKIDWLDLRDVEIPETTNIKLMFNNAKISALSCTDPRIIDAAMESIPGIDITT